LPLLLLEVPTCYPEPAQLVSAGKAEDKAVHAVGYIAKALFNALYRFVHGGNEYTGGLARFVDY